MKTIITVASNGCVMHRNDKGQLHRLDGPAMETHDGTKRWYMNDMRHRGDGPAVEFLSGQVEWWYENIYFKSPQDIIKANILTEDEKTIMILKYGK